MPLGNPHRSPGQGSIPGGSQVSGGSPPPPRPERGSPARRRRGACSHPRRAWARHSQKTGAEAAGHRRLHGQLACDAVGSAESCHGIEHLWWAAGIDNRALRVVALQHPSRAGRSRSRDGRHGRRRWRVSPRSSGRGRRGRLRGPRRGSRAEPGRARCARRSDGAVEPTARCRCRRRRGWRQLRSRKAPWVRKNCCRVGPFAQTRSPTASSQSRSVPGPMPSIRKSSWPAMVTGSVRRHEKARGRKGARPAPPSAARRRHVELAPAEARDLGVSEREECVVSAGDASSPSPHRRGAPMAERRGRALRHPRAEGAARGPCSWCRLSTGARPASARRSHAPPRWRRSSSSRRDIRGPGPAAVRIA